MKFSLDPVSDPLRGMTDTVRACSAAPLFSRDPARVAVIMHYGFKVAVTRILAELFNGQALVVVTGGAGLGKSLLLGEVGRVLRAAGWHVAADSAFMDLIRNDRQEKPAGGPVAVLIDGPGQISPVQMQRLLRLRNLAIVLALPDMAQPSFPSCAPVWLTPMLADASAYYLGAWLRQTGTKPDLLDEEGAARVIGLSQGVPRVLSLLLCDLAGQTAEGASPLSHADIDEAARRLGLPAGPVQPLAAGREFVADALHAATGFGSGHVAFFEPEADKADVRGWRRLMPTNPGSAALVGLICGIGAAIAGLLLQDLPWSARDDAAASSAAVPVERGR